jgi:hypothetical protein
MNADQILILARRHLGKGEMDSSARLCLNAAIAAKDDGSYTFAKIWARKSIKYSVGIMHPDYIKATKDA